MKVDDLALYGNALPLDKGMPKPMCQTPSPGKKYVHRGSRPYYKPAYRADQYAAYDKIIDTEQCQRKLEMLLDAND